MREKNSPLQWQASCHRERGGVAAAKASEQQIRAERAHQGTA